jgi:hypothetical protein
VSSLPVVGDWVLETSPLLLPVLAPSLSLSAGACKQAPAKRASCKGAARPSDEAR